MYFRQFFDPRTAAMSYLIADPSSGQAVLIDPNPDPCQALVFRALLAERRLELALVLLTHAHGPALDGLADPYPGTVVVAGVVPNAGDGFRQAIDGEMHFGNEAIRVIAPGPHAGQRELPRHDRLFCGDALELGGCTRADRRGRSGPVYDSVVTASSCCRTRCWCFLATIFTVAPSRPSARSAAAIPTFWPVRGMLRGRLPPGSRRSGPAGVSGPRRFTTETPSTAEKPMSPPHHRRLHQLRRVRARAFNEAIAQGDDIPPSTRRVFGNSNASAT